MTRYGRPVAGGGKVGVGQVRGWDRADGVVGQVRLLVGIPVDGRGVGAGWGSAGGPSQALRAAFALEGLGVEGATTIEAGRGTGVGVRGRFLDELATM